MTAFYPRALTTVLLPAYDWVRGRQYSQRRKLLDQTQWWSPDAIRDFQWTELEKLLDHAFTFVPYLERKYRAAGIRREDVRTWDDFRRLPVLTREEVNEHGRQLCSLGFHGRLVPHATGGSTGTPTRFFHTYESYEWRTAAKDRAYSWSGWRVGQPSAYLWGAAVKPMSRRQRWKIRAHEAVQRQHIFNTFAQSDELWRRIQAKATAIRPALLVGYVSSLEQFAAFLRREQLAVPGVQAVIAAAEPLDEDVRRSVEEAIGARVYNSYGAREFMSIAAECPWRSGLHVNAENLIVETPGASSGQPSEILVTDLHNVGMPFIRYAIGDLGTASDRTCPCGRGLPLLESVAGRVLDALRTPDGRIVPGEFFPHLLKEVPELVQFRVEQRRIDRIVISAVLSRPLSADSRTLLDREIGKVFGRATSWTIVSAREIPPSRSGKRRVTVGLAAFGEPSC